MPTYEYRCQECTTPFEVTMRPKDLEDANVECLSCGTDKVQREYRTFPGIVYKASGYTQAGSSKYSEKIKTGSLLDGDIHEIMTSDDHVAKDELENKANVTFKQKKDLEDKYGKGSWDGVDNNGMLYKDISVAEIVKT